MGMKKRFVTVFHESAQAWDTILVSAGKIGAQVEVSPRALADLVGGTFAEATG